MPQVQSAKAERERWEHHGRRFCTKIIGVADNNLDGSSRQEAVRQCRAGDELMLIRETGSHDRHAIAVCTLRHQQLGLLSSDVAHELAPLIEAGYLISAVVSELTGGGRFFNRMRGMNIMLWVQRGD